MRDISARPAPLEGRRLWLQLACLALSVAVVVTGTAIAGDCFVRAANCHQHGACAEICAVPSVYRATQ